MEGMLGELGEGLFFQAPLPKRLQQVGSEGGGKGQGNIVFSCSPTVPEGVTGHRTG